MRWIGICAVSLVVAVVALAIGGGTGMLIAGVALGVLVCTLAAGRYVLRPLGDVIEAANAIAGGDYGARVRPRPPGVAGEVSDAFNAMAERVQVEMSEASQERGRLEAALNSSIDAVAALDGEGRILFANVGFEETFGVTSEQVTGTPLVWVLADNEVVEAIRASRERGLKGVNLIERPGRRYLQVVTTPIAGGGKWNVLLVCHDLTDVKRTELVRRDFVANVSHELRTPLASIKSVVETLQDGALDEPDVAQEFLRRADQEVDRIVLLVEELLELSRIESGEQPLLLDDTNVSALLGDVVQRLQSQAERGELELVLEGNDAGIARIDAARIERTVINLVQNAIKFTPPGGRVTVSARRHAGTLEIDVSDTGIGISEEDIPRVFERFYKVDHSRVSGGSGLGLALVKHAVEAHGGSASVRSTPGEGSTFTITVPLAP